MANYQSSYTGAQIDTAVAKINNLLDAVYPVGSIYMSVNNVNPGTFIGGTWQQIQDRFLLAAGSSYVAGSTGGNATHVHTTGGHTLTVAEIPAHSHAIYSGWGDYDSTQTSDAYRYQQWAKNNLGWHNGSAGTIGISNTGGGGSHSHGNTGSASSLPPYLAVYVWERTA